MTDKCRVFRVTAKEPQISCFALTKPYNPKSTWPHEILICLYILGLVPVVTLYEVHYKY